MDNVYLFLGTAALVAVGHAFYRARTSQRYGPPGYPIVGNALQFGRLPHATLTRWAKEYGELYMLQMGTVQWAVLSSAEAINELIVKKGHIAASRPQQYVVGEIFSYGHRGILFSPYADLWKQNRRVFSKALSKSMVSTYTPIVEYAVKKFAKNLLHFSEESKEQGVHALDFCNHYTLNALLGTIFGERRDTLNDPTYLAILVKSRETVELGSPTNFLVDFLPFLRPFNIGTTKAIEIRDSYNALLAQLVDEYRARMADPEVEVPPCMARTIIEAVDEGIYDELEAQILFGSILTAGTDTTASAINWLTIFLTQYPEVQAKMQDEVDRIVGRDRLPTEEDLKDLVYLQHVVRECTRMRPPLPLGLIHTATEDLVYKDTIIPAGAWIITNLFGLHQDAEKYPEPHVFNPDRWETEDRSLCAEAMGMQDKRDNWAFGAGRRICVGMHLAEMEFSIAAAYITWSFNVGIGKGEVIDVHDEEPGIVMQPTRRRLRFQARHPNVREMLART